MDIEHDLDKTVPFKATRSKKEIEKIVRTGKLTTHFQLEKRLGEGGMGTIFKQTVSGLKHTWDNYKIVHRDIKPANIMVTPEGVVKIVDMGLAKPIGKNQEMPDVTGNGVPIGTPQYMAPEQARGEDDVDFRTDIFALGATLYELCVSQKAFRGNTPAQVYHCQVKREYTTNRGPT